MQHRPQVVLPRRRTLIFWGVAVAVCFVAGTVIPSLLFGARPQLPQTPAEVAHAVAVNHFSRARQLFDQKVNGLAIDEGKLCLAAEPDNARCHRLLGEIYAKLNQRPEAILHYRAFVEQTQPQSEGHQQVKLLLFGLEHP